MNIDDAMAYSFSVTHNGETRYLPPTLVKDLDRRVAETIHDLSDDGFNPYGCGPEPIAQK